MSTQIAQKEIQKLKREVETLWQVIEDERLWHPSMIQEIQRRSRVIGKNYKKLRTAEEVW